MMRQTSLVVFTLLLGVCYVYFFTDWFRGAAPIEIYATVRPSVSQFRHMRDKDKSKDKDAAPAETYPVTFNFKQEYTLNEIKVVVADEFKTNKYAHPVWHMISDSSSKPTKGFTYGNKIAGMKPSIPRGKAEPLQTDVTYLLLLDAGKSKGEVTFKTKGIKQS